MPTFRTTPPAPARNPGATGPGTLRTALTMAAIASYVAAFYAVDPRRRLLLGFILVPEELIASWVDHDWSRLGLAGHLGVLAGASVIWGGSFLAGWLVLRFLQLGERFDRVERTVFALGIGLSVWSLITLVSGLAGLLQSRWLFGLLGLAVVVAAAWRAVAGRSSGLSPPNLDSSDRKPEPLTRYGRGALWLCLPLVLAMIVGGMLPPTHFDVREYHLQVPKEWYQAGRITFLPHNVYGNMPLGAELHAVLGMNLWWGSDSWWWGSLIGKTVLAGFGPLGAASVFALGRKYWSSDAGAWGAFAYLSTPWIGHVSLTGLIDAAVGCFVVLAVAAAVPCVLPRAGAAEDAGQEERFAWRAAALAGFFAGSAVACKYPALLFLLLPLGALIALVPWGRVHGKPALAFAFAAAIACGPWFAKNAVLAGNPTYPLLYRVFGGKSWDAEQNARWTKAHGPPHDAAGRSFTLAQAWESLRVLALTSDHHSPWLLPLAAAAAWLWPHQRIRRLGVLLVGLIGFSILTWWFLTHRLDRFLVPLLPLAAVLAGLGATWTDNPGWRRGILGLGVWCAISTFLHLTSGYAADNRFLVSLADLRTDIPRDEEHASTRINDGHRWLNQNVPSGYTALLVGEAQVFDLEVPILYNTCFDDCQLELLLRDRTAAERRQILRERQISHVFVSWYELRRYREPGNYGYSPFPTPELFRELVEEQQLLRPVPLPVDPRTLQIFEVIGVADAPSASPEPTP